ncbi:MAG: hypothetical protein ABL921_34250, partial [Pirellula sp.]
MRPKDILEFTRIRDHLIHYSETERSLHGVVSAQSLNSLVEQIVESQRRVRYLSMIAARIHDPCCCDPSSVAFDPLK